MAASRTIIIAGAGIGGLTASLTLAAAGFQIIVLEREPSLNEAGAGLQLSPNASRILIDLGLGEQLLPHVVAPDAINLMTTRSGKQIGRIPLGEPARLRYGAPYWLIRRADLQAALLARVNENPSIDLRLGAPIEDVAACAGGVSVGFRQNDTPHEERASALIGADGVWSAVRQQLAPDVRPQFTGRIAWRGLIDANTLPRQSGPPCVQLWMGPNAHLVAYPLAGGERINLVATLTGTWDRPGWSEPGAAADITSHFASPLWPAEARAMVGAVEDWRKWALYAMPGGGVWGQGNIDQGNIGQGNIALLGDAAHAMLPFVAQGAGMAIEDAAVLAQCGKSDSDIGAALARYARLRAPRVARMIRTARQSGQIYHLRGPMAFARDCVMGALGGARLMKRQDWIYDWRG